MLKNMVNKKALIVISLFMVFMLVFLVGKTNLSFEQLTGEKSVAFVISKIKNGIKNNSKTQRTIATTSDKAKISLQDKRKLYEIKFTTTENNVSAEHNVPAEHKVSAEHLCSVKKHTMPGPLEMNKFVKSVHHSCIEVATIECNYTGNEYIWVEVTDSFYDVCTGGCCCADPTFNPKSYFDTTLHCNHNYNDWENFSWDNIMDGTQTYTDYFSVNYNQIAHKYGVIAEPELKINCYMSTQSQEGILQDYDDVESSIAGLLLGLIFGGIAIVILIIIGIICCIRKCCPKNVKIQATYRPNQVNQGNEMYSSANRGTQGVMSYNAMSYQAPLAMSYQAPPAMNFAPPVNSKSPKKSIEAGDDNVNNDNNDPQVNKDKEHKIQAQGGQEEIRQWDI